MLFSRDTIEKSPVKSTESTVIILIILQSQFHIYNVQIFGKYFSNFLKFQL
jgi:hypothetical protein